MATFTEMATFSEMATGFILLPLFLILLAATLKKSFDRYFKSSPFLKLDREKLTHLHFYFHDVITGDKPTAVKVVDSPGTNSATLFGIVYVADEPLTEGPDRSSKEIGRAQGMFASTDMNNLGFTMVFNLLFTEGEFNGSTLAMYGRNPIFSEVREMPIIGGTSAFRFARGYAQAKTYELVGSNAVVEYDVFVSH